MKWSNANRPIIFFVFALLISAVCVVAPAATLRPGLLRMGLELLPESVDPHRYYNFSSRNLAVHIFEPLVMVDAADNPVPALATGWVRISDNLWRFHLRHDVRFHHGGSFDATDVVYSFCRLRSGPAAGMVPLMKRLGAVEVESDDTVLLHLSLPDPDLMANLWTVSILDAPNGWSGHYRNGMCDQPIDMAAAGLDDPSHANGTGPYELAGFIPGERAKLRRFDGYWGPLPDWSQVEMLHMAQGADRNRALLQGDVDLVNAVTIESLAHFSDRSDIRLVNGTLLRSWLLFLKQDNGDRQVGGMPNPFSDVRVRRAALLAIDRPMLVQRLMMSGAEPGWQIVPSGNPAFVPDLPHEGPDIELARDLLRQAGFVDGIDITLQASDVAEKLAQALGRSLTRVGIRTRLVITSPAVNVTNAQTGNFQLLLLPVNMLSAEYGSLVRSLFASRDMGPAFGVFNYGGYKSATMDALVMELTGNLSKEVRQARLRHAAELTQQEVPIIPLVHTGRVWAMRSGITIPARLDGLTLAMDVRPVKQ
jgi:peptide/nickel transport system substrate-binding protein